MMSVSRFAYNLELWFWSTVINLFSSSSNRVQSTRAGTLLKMSSLKRIGKTMLASMLGLAIGFTLGLLFL